MQLIINGIEAQLREDTIISFTKESAESENPASVTTPYSKSINLPRTPYNERIFAFIGSLQTDFTNLTFSPIKRSPITVSWDNGTSMDGYCHLDKVTDSDLSITIYLDLGERFNQLKSLYPGDVFGQYCNPIILDQSVVSS